MRRIDAIAGDKGIEDKELPQEDENDNWGEGCCEDVLMEDEFYEREYCD